MSNVHNHENRTCLSIAVPAEPQALPTSGSIAYGPAEQTHFCRSYRFVFTLTSKPAHQLIFLRGPDQRDESRGDFHSRQ